MSGVRQGGRELRPEGRLCLPPGYCLDESDPDILASRRSDGTVVAFFSAQGATGGTIEETAWEDYKRREERDQ